MDRMEENYNRATEPLMVGYLVTLFVITGGVQPRHLQEAADSPPGPDWPDQLEIDVGHQRVSGGPAVTEAPPAAGARVWMKLSRYRERQDDITALQGFALVLGFEREGLGRILRQM